MTTFSFYIIVAMKFTIWQDKSNNLYRRARIVVMVHCPLVLGWQRCTWNSLVCTCFSLRQSHCGISWYYTVYMYWSMHTLFTHTQRKRKSDLPSSDNIKRCNRSFPLAYFLRTVSLVMLYAFCFHNTFLLKANAIIHYAYHCRNPAFLPMYSGCS